MIADVLLSIKRAVPSVTADGETVTADDHEVLMLIGGGGKFREGGRQQRGKDSRQVHEHAGAKNPLVLELDSRYENNSGALSLALLERPITLIPATLDYTQNTRVTVKLCSGAGSVSPLAAV